MKKMHARNQGQVVFEYFILFVLIAVMSIIVSSNTFTGLFRQRMDSFTGGAVEAMEQNGLSHPANGTMQTPWLNGDRAPEDDGSTNPPGWWW